MYVIRSRNVNQALSMGYDYLLHHGLPEESRVGPVLVAPHPVTTVYTRPRERVLFSAVRDANPFFHLAEAIWMLLGRADARFLDYFVHDFGSRFAEADGLIHGAYGRRWRGHFYPVNLSLDTPSTGLPMDQLQKIVEELKNNNQSRQAVLAMWDPEVDLGAVVRDKPCNTHVYFRVRGERGDINHGNGNVSDYDDRELDMTVCCRSNDIIMGAYGANVVHFSILQEFLAASIGIKVGTYSQVSNNYHLYLRDVEMIKKRAAAQGVSSDVPLWEDNSHWYTQHQPSYLVTSPETFLQEAAGALNWYEFLVQDKGPGPVLDRLPEIQARTGNKFIRSSLLPMLASHAMYKAGDLDRAWTFAEMIDAPDWRQACTSWVRRRIDRRVENYGKTGGEA